ncbi:MAG: hypothetical protein PHH82_02775 [Candidatus ainarchaeum sp.]|nr:hypothetical protein [Candidatus ainarchaeum sp.]
MKRYLSALIFLIFCVSFVFATPGDWKGIVDINGSEPEVGTTVSAYTGSTLLDSTTTPTTSAGATAYDSNGFYILVFETTIDAALTFKVCGITADTNTFSVGTHDLNISATLQANGTAACTCDGICSGGHCVNPGASGVCSANTYYCNSNGSCETAYGETSSNCSADCSSGGGSGGSGGSSTIIIAETTEEAIEIGSEETITTTVSSGGSRTIKVKDEEHTVTVDETNVEEQTARITIASTPMTYILKTGQSVKADFENDGVYDLKVTLGGVDASGAKLYLLQIAEPVAKAADTTKEPTGGTITTEDKTTTTTDDGSTTTDNTTGTTDTEETISSAWVWWVLGVIIVLVVVYLGYAMIKK